MTSTPSRHPEAVVPGPGERGDRLPVGEVVGAALLLPLGREVDRDVLAALAEVAQEPGVPARLRGEGDVVGLHAQREREEPPSSASSHGLGDPALPRPGVGQVVGEGRLVVRTRARAPGPVAGGAVDGVRGRCSGGVGASRRRCGTVRPSSGRTRAPSGNSRTSAPCRSSSVPPTARLREPAAVSGAATVNSVSPAAAVRTTPSWLPLRGVRQLTTDRTPRDRWTAVATPDRAPQPGQRRRRSTRPTTTARASDEPRGGCRPAQGPAVAVVGSGAGTGA